VPWYSLVVLKPCCLVSCIAGYVRRVGERTAVSSGPGDGECRTNAALGCGGQVARLWGSGFVIVR
jgi:hypothetical protein